MDKNIQNKLLDFLQSSMDTDGSMQILAAASMELESDTPPTTSLVKVRIAVALADTDSNIPYFDGTDLYVEIGPDTIRFARECEWAEGPPIMEGSPIELVIPWVSELAPPFYVSLKAFDAATHGKSSIKSNPTTIEADDSQKNISEDDKFDHWF